MYLTHVQSYPPCLHDVLYMVLNAGGLIVERQGFVEARHDGRPVIQANRLNSGPLAGKWSVYHRSPGSIKHHLVG